MIILEELEDEIQWNISVEHSQDVLAKLAKEAMSEYHAGKTQENERSRSQSTTDYSKYPSNSANSF
ncbi:hypothetical protein VB774_22935 [Pseudanabaena galeata UHCC 0370]|uniref:Uncharacterized protein n=1 Tax=Pseudanabaena galeata UHCC 0370 TaxID=3110310 RepID=A0ABU5TQC7_9CYAN|nr:hypothetical protein [Pseudanabaena galeata]MEA5480500.1 hypothetical protein [Pseudanabaena galeata UHCC 0370]